MEVDMELDEDLNNLTYLIYIVTIAKEIVLVIFCDVLSVAMFAFDNYFFPHQN